MCRESLEMFQLSLSAFKEKLNNLDVLDNECNEYSASYVKNEIATKH